MNIMESTTSRGASVSIIFAVLALLVVVIPFSSVQKNKQPTYKPLVLRSDAEIALLRGDRDGNNIPDWKDAILETMSSTTKEELNQIPIDEETVKRLNDPNNLTSSFSKNILAASAFVSKNPTMTDAEQSELVTGLVKDEVSKIKPKTYSLEDLTLTKSDSDTERKVYGNAMALLLKKSDSFDLTSDDMAPLARYNETQDEADLSFFVTKKNNVHSILQGLLALQVPPSAAVFHLNLINAVSIYEMALDAFASTKDDPIKSITFLNAYGETTQNLFVRIAASHNYFSLVRVPFTEKDPGYVFIEQK